MSSSPSTFPSPPLASPYHDTVFDRSLIVSRLAGLITSGPSMLLTLIVFNSLRLRYEGRMLQRAVLFSCILSLINDILVLFTMSKWLVDHDDTYWPLCILAINAIKRIHSITTAHLVFLRTTSLFRQLQPFKKWVNPLTAAYAVLGLTSLALHAYAYHLGNWNTNIKRTLAVFRFGYRSTNFLCVLLYALPAIATDIAFFTRNRLTSTMRRRLDSINVFYEPMLYCCLECIMVLAVCVPLVLNFFDKSMDWTSPTYTEQLLLAIIALNSMFSVKAATLLPGETDVESCDEGVCASAVDVDVRVDAFVVSSQSGRVHRPGSRVSRALGAMMRGGGGGVGGGHGIEVLASLPRKSNESRSDLRKVGFPLPQLLLPGFDQPAAALCAGEPLYLHPVSPSSPQTIDRQWPESARSANSSSSSGSIARQASLESLALEPLQVAVGNGKQDGPRVGQRVGQ